MNVLRYNFKNVNVLCFDELRSPHFTVKIPDINTEYQKYRIATNMSNNAQIL